MDKPENPRVFPHEAGQICAGMSLLDYFAGQALAGGRANANGGTLTPADLTKTCYDDAEALLAERQRRLS